MGSFRRRHFDPLDLEIIDRVYEAAWAQLQARDPYRGTAEDAECQEALRKWIFALAIPGQFDFDTLCDKVLAGIPDLAPKSEPSPDVPEAGARAEPRHRLLLAQ